MYRLNMPQNKVSKKYASYQVLTKCASGQRIAKMCRLRTKYLQHVSIYVYSLRYFHNSDLPMRYIILPLQENEDKLLKIPWKIRGWLILVYKSGFIFFHCIVLYCIVFFFLKSIIFERFYDATDTPLIH